MPLIKGYSKKDESQSEMKADKAPKQSMAMALNIQRQNKKKPHMAQGGEVKAPMSDAEEHYSSIADAILAKKRDAGMVDLNENAIESENVADELNMDAAGKENYSEADGLESLSQPMDSNEHGDELEDTDSHDMSDIIRKKMKLKRGA